MIYLPGIFLCLLIQLAIIGAYTLGVAARRSEPVVAWLRLRKLRKYKKETGFCLGPHTSYREYEAYWERQTYVQPAFIRNRIYSLLEADMKVIKEKVDKVVDLTKPKTIYTFTDAGK